MLLRFIHFAALACLGAASAHAQEIRTLEINTRGIGASFSNIRLTELNRPSYRFSVESLDSFSHYRFHIDSPGHRVKLEAALENSLNLVHEGATLALPVQQQSAWRSLETSNGMDFAAPQFSDDERQQFSALGADDIATAASRLPTANPGLIQQARRCATPTTFPCLVEPNGVKVRVLIQQGTDWVMRHELQFDLTPS